MMDDLSCTSSSSSPPPLVRMPSHSHRIVIYTTCYNVLDGVTLTIRKIEQEILAAGHSLIVLTTKSGDPANTHLNGEHPNRQVHFLDNSIPIPFLTDPNNSALSYHLGFSLSRNIKQLIQDFEPTLIHITVPDCTCLHLIQYAREREIPLMGTFHSNIPEYFEHYPGLSWLGVILGDFFRFQYNFLQALYVPTPFVHAHLVKNYKMDKLTSLRIWGRGIDLEQFSPAHRSLSWRRELGIGDKEAVVLWVGRIVPEKRPDIFAAVIRKLHQNNIPFKAVVVGAGPNEDLLMSLPNTIYLGWQSGQALATAYASSDVFLFPSAVETFGNVTLEASSSGLPLVVDANCSGHLVSPGINGYDCPSTGGPMVVEEAYYQGTLKLLQNASLRHKMSKASRELSLPREKSVVVKRMLDNYTQVTQEFYTVYGGHHANRDKAYTTQDKRPAGSHPRPFLLQLFEIYFIILFYIMWYSATAVFWLHGHVMASFGLSVPNRGLVRPAPHVVTTTKRLPTKQQHTQVLIPTAAPEDVENPELDDLTDATSVSSSATTATTTTSCLQELNLSKNVAACFSRSLMFQFRMESKLRTFLSFCVSPSKWQQEPLRKRKNSSVISPCLYDRKESGGSVDFSDLSSTASSSSDLGLRVRNNSLPVETI